MSAPSRRVLALVAAFTPLAASAPAEPIFQDGFEECGFGRWSAGEPDPIPEQLTGLEPLALAAAMGACPPSLTGAEFRFADGTVPLPASAALAQMRDEQTAILHAFGTGGVTPTAGGAMAVLASGRARDLDMPGHIPPEPGRDFARATPGPAVFTAAHGGVFPGAGACPDGPNDVHDSVGLRLTFVVPPGATRLAFDWRWFTADHPEWVCTSFSDYGLGIVITGSAPSLPADRDLLLDSQDLPLSSNTVDLEFCATCPGGSGPLDGSGYSADDAAATDWRTSFVPVVAGETLVFDLIAFDIDDGQIDNLTLLDGLRWLAD